MMKILGILMGFRIDHTKKLNWKFISRDWAADEFAPVAADSLSLTFWPGCPWNKSLTMLPPRNQCTRWTSTLMESNQRWLSGGQKHHLTLIVPWPHPIVTPMEVITLIIKSSSVYQTNPLLVGTELQNHPRKERLLGAVWYGTRRRPHPFLCLLHLLDLLLTKLPWSTIL